MDNVVVAVGCSPVGWSSSLCSKLWLILIDPVEIENYKKNIIVVRTDRSRVSRV